MRPRAWIVPVTLAGLLAAAAGAKYLFVAASDRTPPPGAMAKIPKGDFTMGTNEEDRSGQGTEFGSPKPWFQDEHPAHRVSLPTYSIDHYEVTNQQYRKFVDDGRAPSPPTWSDGRFPPEQARWPVTGVTWFEADRYCRWASKRLPTEAEWEKAARGPEGRVFPWGDAFDEKKGNIGGNGLAPVGSFPEGRSPYGIFDMAGNVSEWVADWYLPYPGSSYTHPAFGERFKVVRNSSWGGSIGHYTLAHFYRGSYRFFQPPDRRFRDVGFRCARNS